MPFSSRVKLGTALRKEIITKHEAAMDRGPAAAGQQLQAAAAANAARACCCPALSIEPASTVR
jgi:hypothetical protein